MDENIVGEISNGGNVTKKLKRRETKKKRNQLVFDQIADLERKNRGGQ